MSDRILEIAHPAHLRVRDAQLVIELDQRPPFQTPVSGINTLLLAHPQVTLTQAVVSRLAEAGAMLVTIDHRYLPIAMTLPLQEHSLQTERLAAQANIKPAIRKRLWQQIIQA
jgi:CRISPR-associated protein Cas1